MKEAILNLGWTVGVRAFRLTRKLRLSGHLEPVFAKVASVVPKSRQPVEATLSGGAKLVMPGGYRDVRSVLTGLFQADETRLFESRLRAGMTFVDVGSYVGYFTVLAAGLVGPSGRVFSFEPDPLPFEYLLRNVAANGYDNVVAVNKALSRRRETLSLVRDPTGPETFTTDISGGGRVVTVEATSLDEFFAANRWPSVDAIKMNIEGAELRALQGMRQLSLLNPKLWLVMEHNPAALRRAGATPSALTAILHDLGFARAQIVERGLQTVPGGDLLPTGSAVYNVLFMK